MTFNLAKATASERKAYFAGCKAERTMCWLRIMKTVKKGELTEPDASIRKGLMLAAALVNDDQKMVEELLHSEAA